MAKRRFTDEQEQEMALEYLAGDSLDLIAVRWGCSRPTVRLALDRTHTTVRSPSERNRGERNPMWTGGRQTWNGYAYVRVYSDDPMRCMGPVKGYVGEHRLVMARHLKRPLEAWESVHHINGDRQDNRIENLQLRVGQHGGGQAMACLDCGSQRIGHIPLAEAS